MSRREVQLVLLCEDAQHEAFARRLLGEQGWVARQIRVEKAPSAKQSAEQWVRQRYPSELQALRRRPHIARALIVMVDADTNTYDERLCELDDALRAASCEVRTPKEPVPIIVPRRNIETWIAYLGGSEVDEVTEYPKLRRERECAPAVRQLKAMCDSGTLRDPAPPSLQQACNEYRKRMPQTRSG